jgi:hypothetical protein
MAESVHPQVVCCGASVCYWDKADIANISANVRFREADRTSMGVAELRIVTEFGLSLAEFGQEQKRTV